MLLQKWSIQADDNLHVFFYPPLYSIGFDVQDLFGSESPDKAWMDVHEEWLEDPGAG